MKIIEEIQDDVTIYRLNGRLDSNTSPELEIKLSQAISDGSQNMVINFKDLFYISSAGIRVILKSIRAIKRNNGLIILCCMQAYVKEVFEISGVDFLSPIVASMDDALKAF